MIHTTAPRVSRIVNLVRLIALLSSFYTFIPVYSVNKFLFYLNINSPLLVYGWIMHAFHPSPGSVHTFIHLLNNIISIRPSHHVFKKTVILVLVFCLHSFFKDFYLFFPSCYCIVLIPSQSLRITYYNYLTPSLLSFSLSSCIQKTLKIFSQPFPRISLFQQFFPFHSWRNMTFGQSLFSTPSTFFSNIFHFPCIFFYPFSSLLLLFFIA